MLVLIVKFLTHIDVDVDVNVALRSYQCQVLTFSNNIYRQLGMQDCTNCAILPYGMGARGVSSEHVENMEMFSCSPT